MSRLLEVAVWWVATTGLWLLTLSSVDGPDLLAALVAGAVAGVGPGLFRTATASAFALRPGWSRWLLQLPFAVVTDSAQVTAVALLEGGRRLLGRGGSHLGLERTVLLPLGEPDALGGARRAVGALAVTTAPGTYVAQTLPQTGRSRPALVEHVLVRTRPGWTTVDPAAAPGGGA